MPKYYDYHNTKNNQGGETDMKRLLKKPVKKSQKQSQKVILFGGSKKDECRIPNCYKC